MEKIYVLYDNKYFGEGYFVVVEYKGKIKKFLKISLFEQNLFIRAFEVGSHDKDDMIFRNIDFCVKEDSDLYNIFSELYNFIGGTNVFTIDTEMHGYNHVNMYRKDDSIVLTLAKDVWKGTEVGTDFIIINLGDKMIILLNFTIFIGIYLRFLSAQLKKVLFQRC